jgi:hypothetical protein
MFLLFNVKYIIMRKATFKNLLLLFVVLVSISVTSGCQPAVTDDLVTITEAEVLSIQKTWSDGIVQIGEVYLNGGDYKQAAEDHIDNLYGYNLGTVLFKPTLASEVQFRITKEGALSYFVGENSAFAEDHGFAIKPWSAVRWESKGIKIIGNMAIAMGNYYFTPAKGGDDVKVEYTFAYTKDENGDLRIILHGSHIPFSN